MMVNDGVVVKTHSLSCCSPRSNPWGTHFHSIFSQQNWRVETMGSGVTRLCDGDVSWLLWNRAGWGCGNSGTGMCLADSWGWVVNLFYCLCWDLDGSVIVVVRAINELYRVKGTGRCWHSGYHVYLQDVEFQYDTHLEVTSLFSLIAIGLTFSSDWVGGSRASWLLQNGKSWECGNGGAGVY